MNNIANNDSFIGYDYKEVITNREMENMYADGYTSFGWTLNNAVNAAGFLGVTLKFRRNRKIRNKAELSRLQRKFESGAQEIENLEKSKTTGASITALSVGLAGTAFMAAAVFSFMGGMIPLMIILAIPGLAGWALSYFCYGRVKGKKILDVEPLIEKQYDEIYDVCAEAYKLLEA